jgi:hypothetical protein
MSEGEAKLATTACFVADPYLKFVVIVDHDIDINNDTEVCTPLQHGCVPTRMSSWCPSQGFATRSGFLRPCGRLEPKALEVLLDLHFDIVAREISAQMVTIDAEFIRNT